MHRIDYISQLNHSSMKKNILLIGIVTLSLSVFTSCDPVTITPPGPDPSEFNMVAYCNYIIGKSFEDVKTYSSNMNFVLENKEEDRYYHLAAYYEGETTPYMYVTIEFDEANYCITVSANYFSMDDEELYYEWKNIIQSDANMTTMLEDKLSENIAYISYDYSLTTIPDSDNIDFRINKQIQQFNQYYNKWNYCVNITQQNCINSETYDSTYNQLKEKIVSDYQTYIVQRNQLNINDYKKECMEESVCFHIDNDSDKYTVILSFSLYEHVTGYGVALW